MNVAGGAELVLDVGGSQQWTAASINALLADAQFGPSAMLGLDTNGGRFNLASIDTHGIGLTVVGSSSLTLTASSSFSGVTTVSQGTLLLAQSAALIDSTVALDEDNGLQFSPGVSKYDLGGLSGGKVLTLADTAHNAIALAVGGNGNSTTFSGEITGGGSLIKTGTGTLVLSGADSYTGGTSVDAGTLIVPNADGLADGSSLTIGAGGTFIFDPMTGATPSADQPLGGPTVLGGGGRYMVPGDVIAVPEPGSLALLTCGLCGLLLWTAGTCHRRGQSSEVGASDLLPLSTDH